MSLMLVPHLSRASEWSVTPQFNAHADYWDNPRLVFGGSDAVEGGTAELSASLMRRTERSELSIAPLLRLRRYSGDQHLDGTDQVINITGKEVTERTTWTLKGLGLRDTTLTSELGTTGYTQVDKRRNYVELSFGPSFSLTERTQLSVGLSGLSADYEHSRDSGLLDYRYVSASITGTRSLSERLQLALSVSAGRNYVPDAPDNEMKNYSATTQLSYDWNPTWSATLWVGPSRVSSLRSSDNGQIYGGSLRHRGELFTIDASLERNVRPTGTGLIEKVDEADVFDSLRLTERLSGGIGISYRRSQQAIPAFRYRAPGVTYFHIDGRLTWQWTERLNIALSAGRNTQRVESPDRTAKGYQVSLGVNWSGVPSVFWH